MTEPTVEKIPQHHHCDRCGKAFVGKGKFCSPQCEEESKAEVKGKLRKYTIIWLILVAVVVVCVVMTL